jgi:hypothetical protein
MSVKRRRLVPDPPSPLPPPRLMTLPAERALLHRTFDGAYAPNDFNPGKGQRTRFAPICTIAGTIIPTLYAGETIEAAYYESVLHDVPTDGDDRVIAHSALIGRQYAALAPTRDLSLAQLFAVDLKKWNLERTQLIDTTSYHYRYTKLWAEALHESLPSIDGLVWTSKKDDEHQAYVLFGDRVNTHQLAIVDGPREIVSDTMLFNLLRDCAGAMGARIGEPDPPGVAL